MEKQPPLLARETQASSLLLESDQLPDGYLSPASILAKVTLKTSEVVEFHQAEDLRITALIKDLDLTPKGRKILLEARPQLIEVCNRSANQMLLPKGWRRFSFADWHQWFRHLSPPIKERYKVLKTHFVNNLSGFYNYNTNQIVLFDGPFLLNQADLQISVIHEFLHAAYQRMPISEKGAAYIHLAEFLQQNLGTLKRSQLPFITNVYQRIKTATNRVQKHYADSFELNAPWQFVEQIYSRPDQDIGLPNNILDVNAIDTLFNEAFAYIGSELDIYLPAGLEACYYPYLRHRAQTIRQLKQALCTQNQSNNRDLSGLSNFSVNAIRKYEDLGETNPASWQDLPSKLYRDVSSASAYLTGRNFKLGQLVSARYRDWSEYQRIGQTIFLLDFLKKEIKLLTEAN